MKILLPSRDLSSKGAALMIVLAFVVLLTGLALAYFSRAGTDRQLAQSSFNDTNADLLARSALDIVVGDFKQEILSHPTVTPNPPYYISALYASAADFRFAHCKFDQGEFLRRSHQPHIERELHRCFS